MLYLCTLQLVQDLERELSEYERTTGYPPHPPPSSSSSPHQPGTLGGLTASLLRSVTRLAHYLRHSEVQLRGEVAVRGQLLHTMTEQQNLMDALTTVRLLCTVCVCVTRCCVAGHGKAEEGERGAN